MPRSLTKKLSAESYYSNKNLKPWGTAELIQERVNREAFVTEEIQTPPIPEYTPVKKYRLSEVNIRAFARAFLP